MHSSHNLRSPWLVSKLDLRNAYDLVGGKITIKIKWIKFWIFLCVWRLASVDVLGSLIVCVLLLLLVSALENGSYRCSFWSSRDHTGGMDSGVPSSFSCCYRGTKHDAKAKVVGLVEDLSDQEFEYWGKLQFAEHVLCWESHCHFPIIWYTLNATINYFECWWRWGQIRSAMDEGCFSFIWG